MTQLKISVITWDAGFRESFHTVDFFRNQSFPPSKYEFIWVEYYSDVNPRLRQKMSGLENARIICLGGENDWHIGKCLNEGIKQGRGEVLVICDGDIVVEPDFLDSVWSIHNKMDDLILYFRRWDEPKSVHELPITLHHLREVCQLLHPSNYGGCLTTRRDCVNYVHGYEEHPIFVGAGTISTELYTRLKNAGFPIVWHPSKKVYHPWHTNTLRGTYKLKRDQTLWIIQCRHLSVDHLASTDQVRMYLNRFTPQMEALKPLKQSIWRKIKNSFRRTRQLG